MPVQISQRAHSVELFALRCLVHSCRSSRRVMGSGGVLTSQRPVRHNVPVRSFLRRVKRLALLESDPRKGTPAHSEAAPRADIEDITTKTGSFKKFNVFTKMLVSAITEVRLRQYPLELIPFEYRPRTN